MSNFNFLEQDWSEFIEDAKAMEKLVRFDPRGACGRARYLIEQVVLWMYKNDEDLELPYDTSLYNITNELSFRKIIGYTIYEKIKVIRKVGNLAVHENKRISEHDALRVCEETFHIMYWLYRTYTTDDTPKPSQSFDPSLVPDITSGNKETEQRLKQLEEEMEAKADALRKLQQSLEEKDEVLQQRNREIKQMRLQTRKYADDHDYNEASTRELLIDVMLRESGWNPADPNVREFKVEGMPNGSGIGYVDYVLWDDDGKPIALVEAKRTTRDVGEGQHQAKLYADCLEARYQIRPVIFLSNGYEIWIWDDSDYPPRPVQGFYTKDSLQTLFFQRRNKESLKLAEINEDITGRYYQIAAIRRVGERFEEGHRRSLLVMATGTGKTRTSISIVDMMLKKKWAKRVLFLADRNALVKQAYNNYAKHLPDVPIVNLVREKNDEAARIVFSTYPTILNQIEKIEEGKRRFDPGYFDLVIIDEAHRSVYNKYQAIFDYFDSLLLGLTATPKEDVDHDTYNLFNAEQGSPTYAYGLEEAVEDGFLVPPRKISVLGKFLSEGIKYSDLTPEEQKQYDDLLADDETGAVPDHVDPGKLNQWLFNEDTVEQVLQQLMEHGIKVEGGDRIGDTIIFAKNHRHAMFIQEVFDKNYPKYAGHLARVIDNQIEYAQDLIDTFCAPGKMPAIAISVDMMDTGIDAPDCVNLVFFKPVRSKAKFNQMIGRGTRLRPDLFGPGQNKKHFLIFDYCGNFEFFEQNPEGFDTTQSASVSAQIFEKRLLLTAKLKNEPYKHQEELKAYRTQLLDLLHQQIANLEKQSIQVRPHLRIIHRLEDRAVWEHLESHERKEIVRELAELIQPELNEDETARRFDLLMLTLMHERMDGVLGQKKTKEIVIGFGEHLYEKRHIPAVKQALTSVEKIITEDFWVAPPIIELEEIRKEVRELIQLIEKKKRAPVYTDFQDTFGDIEIDDVIATSPLIDKDRYLRKIRKFIEEHGNNLVIEKIRNAQPLTDKDVETLEQLLLEVDPAISADEFHELVGGELDLIRFVREVSGLERQAVMQKFGEFLSDQRLSSTQIQFVEQMIEFFTQKGHLEISNLYEPPFDFIDEQGIDGVFRDKAKVIDILVERIKEMNEVKVG
ncbi:MAG: DEAD/DEAH box helicase family protein [Balneolaceae bacterium]|nr:DEAD/DEAH box helicase family protein [Balneolaceae bacterium]